eukprot:scaffold19040_cov97-Skeletonema_menzelii.AAC.2
MVTILCIIECIDANRVCLQLIQVPAAIESTSKLVHNEGQSNRKKLFYFVVSSSSGMSSLPAMRTPYQQVSPSQRMWQWLLSILHPRHTAPRFLPP